ncbi:hypothetical protein LO771_21350 [Streptacidiphilus sp. ASG 303]|uniref:DUF6671 family protein n=1 Tax=Streptacidiphilus sp. ASG 303 TaxID=2896847 RepID=UPI001E5E2166|nr:DUF6671 family protein [Streptacidiphilus sp. ASG 303]MCD0484867.1 hypothetical protein [Streptacidiphilus sp. ASG 303]
MASTPTARPYHGATVVFGTRHDKHHCAAPAFHDVLGARVTAPPGLDTDQFGTFAGDIPRTLPPLQAATAKARLAMATTATPYGLASEASYGPVGLVNTHEEILVFLDDTRDLCIVEGLRSLDVPGTATDVTDPDTAVEAARSFGFPHQGALVTTTHNGHLHVAGKGITDAAVLRRTTGTALRRSDTGTATVAPDLRAHHNPTRRTLLTRLARRLATRLATPCPRCHAPGYGRTSHRTGLPCRACAWPTDLVTADVHGCARCQHRHTVPRPDTTADPRWCERCNP